jgi:hypothetical protein
VPVGIPSILLSDVPTGLPENGSLTVGCPTVYHKTIGSKTFANGSGGSTESH